MNNPGQRGISRFISIPAVVLLVGVTACGGGGGDSDESTASEDQPVAFPAFAVRFVEGDYWEYQWDSERVVSSASGTSVSTENAEFRLTIGAPVSFDGRQGFSIELTGTPVRDFRWQAISFDDTGLYGSTDGATWQTLFDATTGLWAGGGLFATFDSNTLTQALLGSITNAYVDQPAIQVGRSLSQNQCETIGGIRVCGDESFTLREFEYYDEILGVIAYEYVNNSASSGGGFGTILNFSEDLGLVASSLSGDVLGNRLESEPNNNPVTQAVELVSGEVLRGSVAREDDFGGATEVSLALAEVEPNDDTLTAQVVELPGYVSATGRQTSAINIEDVYRLQVPVGGCQDLFVAHTAETEGRLDMYLFEDDGFGGVVQIADDISTTPLGPSYRTSLDSMPDLNEGTTYYLGVDPVNIFSDMPYTLTFGCGSLLPPQDRDVVDWYKVSLLIGSTLDVNIEGDGFLGFVVTNAAGTVLLGESEEIDADNAGLSIPLSAGEYRIGVYGFEPYNIRATF